MTDIFGLFLFLLSIVFLQNLQEGTREKAGLWIALVVLTGLLAGAIRQLFWLVPLVALGYIAWRRRELRALALGGAAVALVGTVALTLWYTKQPYALGESVVPGIKGIVHNPVPSLLTILGLLMGVTLFLFPVVSAVVLPRLGGGAGKRRLIVGVLALASAGACFLGKWLFPWSYNICSEFGVLRPADTALGDPELVLSTLPRLVLSLVALLSSLCVVEWAIAERATLIKTLQRVLAAQTEKTDHGVVILALYSVPYLLVALSRAGIGMSWDRYLIPVFPLVTILALRSLAGRALPKAAWAALALFGLYSVAVSHDYLAFLRAEATAVQALEKRGVPATQIRANFEFDCWTETEQKGFINDARIHNPVDAYRDLTDEQMRGVWPTGQKVPWWWRFTPSVEGRYFVVTTPIPGLIDTADTPITYQRWLPWTTATIRIQQSPTAN